MRGFFHKFTTYTVIVSLLTTQLAGPTRGQTPAGDGQRVEGGSAAQSKTAAQRATFADGGPRLTGVLRSVYQAPEAERVESLSGLLLLRATDLVVPAGAVQLRLSRNVQTFPAGAGLLGAQWRLNWEKQVQRNQDDAAILEHGAATMFRASGGADEYRSTNGDALTVKSDGAVCVRADGSREKFDAAGRLIEQDLRNGNRFTLSYDDAGRLSRVDGPRQTWLTFTVDPRGRIKQAQASSGATVQYTYDDEELPAGEAALRSRYGYDERGLLNRIEHPRRGPVTLSYDDAGRVVERKWADDASERFEFDAAARTVKRTNPLGHATTTLFSEDMKRIEVVDAADRKTVLQLDALGRPTQVTDAAGRTSSTTYDEQGRTASVDVPGDGTHRYEYDGDARLPATHVGPDGRRLALEYDAAQNLVGMSVEGDETKEFETTYTPEGQVRQITGRKGDALKIAYNARGLLESLTDAAGGVTKFELDPQGNILRQTDALGHATVNGYDPAGRLQTTSSPGGATRRYQYDERGDLVRETDAAGGSTTYEYDARGRLTAVTDPLGRTTKLNYFADGRLKSRTDAAGHEWKFQYDAVGNLVRETDPTGGIVSHQYDVEGRETSVRDAVGVATSYEYTPQGKVSKVVLADGGKASFEHDEQGRVTTATDRYGQVTRHKYDARGNRIETTLPTGVVVTRKYDEAGRLSEIAENGKTRSSFEYDVRGNRTKLKLAAGYEVNYQYDAVGRIVKWTDNLGGGQTTNYDADGRPLESRSANGEAVRYRYDPAGKVAGLSNALGESDRRMYDAAGQLVEFTSAGGSRVEYRYDQTGRINSVLKPSGGELRYEYDAAGRLVSSIDPLSNVARRQYDLAGRVVNSTDAGGRATSFAYDTAGRLIQKRLSDGTNVLYRYDDHGKLLEIDDGVFPIRYAYDARGNRTKIEYPTIKRSLSYEYDQKKRLAGFTDSENVKTTYAYDEFNRLVEAKRGNDAIRFGYDARGRRISTVWPNGVRGEWQYDGANHVTQLKYVGADEKTLAGWTYKYDAGGRLVETVPHEGTTEKFRYDADGQLIERRADAAVDRYAYLPGGNRAAVEQNDERRECRYNAADQLIAVGDDKFEYDASGNLTSRTTTAGTTKYTYDAQNQLVGVTLPGGESIRYGYAATGQPIWREDAKGRTWYVTDGVHVLAELDAKLNAQVGYVHGLGIDQPLAVVRGNTTSYLHADRLGTPTTTSDAQGRLGQTMAYDAFGQPRGKRADGALPLGFTGRWLDDATGLYYYRARWYDPALGRYLSPDAAPPRISMPLTLNPYQYALNNPTGYIDPSGATELADGIVADAWKSDTPEQAIAYLAEQKETVRAQHVDQVDRALEGPHTGTAPEVDAKFRQDLSALNQAQQAIQYLTDETDPVAKTSKVPGPPKTTPTTPGIPQPTTPGPTSPPAIEPSSSVVETAPEPKPAEVAQSAEASAPPPDGSADSLASGPSLEIDDDPFGPGAANALADRIRLPDNGPLGDVAAVGGGRPRGMPRPATGDMDPLAGAAVGRIMGNTFTGAMAPGATTFVWIFTTNVIWIPVAPWQMRPNRIWGGAVQGGLGLAAAIITGVLGAGGAPTFVNGVPVARTIAQAQPVIPTMAPPNRPAPPGTRTPQTAGTGANPTGPQPAANNNAAANNTPAANNTAAANNTPAANNASPSNNTPPNSPTFTNSSAAPSAPAGPVQVASVTPVTPNIPRIPLPPAIARPPLQTEGHTPPPSKPAMRTPLHAGDLVDDFAGEVRRVPNPPPPRHVPAIASIINTIINEVLQPDPPKKHDHGAAEANQAAKLQNELNKYRAKGRQADHDLAVYEQQVEAYNKAIDEYNRQVQAYNQALAAAAAQQAREQIYYTDPGYGGGHGGGYYGGGGVDWGGLINGINGIINSGGGYGGHGHGY